MSEKRRVVVVAHQAPRPPSVFLDTRPLFVFFQVPFFAFAAAGFVRRWNAVRIPCIIYGTSAATSVVPILGDILASEKVTDPQRYKLVCICEKKRRGI